MPAAVAASVTPLATPAFISLARVGVMSQILLPLFCAIFKGWLGTLAVIGFSAAATSALALFTQVAAPPDDVPLVGVPPPPQAASITASPAAADLRRVRWGKGVGNRNAAPPRMQVGRTSGQRKVNPAWGPP